MSEPVLAAGAKAVEFLARCISDPLDPDPEALPYYAQHCLFIRTKARETKLLELNFAQTIVHEILEEQLARQGKVRALILKARQEGISTYVSARFMHRTTTAKNLVTRCMADNLDRSALIFGMYDRYDRGLPAAMHPLRRYVNKGQHLVYDHPVKLGAGLGSEIAVLTAGDPNSGRAATIICLHATELPLWKNAEANFVALMGAIPQTGYSEVIIEFTAQGVGNLAHRMWLEAEDPDVDSEWVAIFLPWFIHSDYAMRVTEAKRDELLATTDPWERAALDVGIEWRGTKWKLTPEQLQWRRVTIRSSYRGDVRAFRQEFPSTAEEAFLTSGSPYFDEEALLEYFKAALKPLARGELIIAEGWTQFAPAELGRLRIWERPRHDGLYVIGADTAAGLWAGPESAREDVDAEVGGRDFDVAAVYDVRTRKFVAEWHARVAPEVFAEALYRLGFWYSNEIDPAKRSIRRPAYLGVEKNHASGETVIDLMQNTYKYPQLHKERTQNRVTKELTEHVGWNTSPESRPIMLDALGAAVRNRNVELPSRPAIMEMQTFIIDEKGKPQAEEGTHDDRVIAYAIALQMEKHVPKPRGPRPKTKPLPADRGPTGWSPTAG